MKNENMQNNNFLAPICLFVYSSFNETKRTVESLQKNTLAPESLLFIFSDGAENIYTIEKVKNVREYIRTVTGFANVTIYESEVNKGLANSIISGVTKIISDFDKVIVIEDDLLLSTNFLGFMNQSLNFYKEEKKILSISGFSFPIKYKTGYKYDVAFSLRASSWGWATWKDRWENIDWEVKTYKTFQRNILKRCKFNRGGSDMSHMLDKQMSGKINSWAIRFCYHQFENDLFDVFPTISKVINIGFGENATNTKKGDFRFRTNLDTTNKQFFNLQKEIKISLTNQIQFYWHFSIIMRILSKIIDFPIKKK